MTLDIDIDFNDLILPFVNGTSANNLLIFNSEHIDYLMSNFSSMIKFMENDKLDKFNLLTNHMEMISIADKQKLITSPFVQALTFFDDISNQQRLYKLISYIMPMANNLEQKRETENFHSPISEETYAENTPISLDFRSYVNVPHKEIEGELIDSVFTSQDIVSHKDKIELALDFINENSPDRYDAIEEYISQIAIRDSVKNKSYSTGSFGGYVGYFFITDVKNATLYDVVDAIIHESMHSIIYTWEYSQGKILNYSGEIIECISPWSNKTITADNKIQAIFVWSSLYFFWKSVYEKGNHKAKKYMERAEKGFMNNDIEKFIESNDYEISREIKKLILTITNSVRG